MLYGHLDHPEQFSFLLRQPAWRTAFNWISSLGPNPQPGRVALDGDAIFGLVMQYDTIPQQLARLESHRKYIDLQFTIAGAETISWMPTHLLNPDGPFDLERDLQFYLPPVSPPHGLFTMLPGHFAVFFPSDAHAPKIAVGGGGGGAGSAGGCCGGALDASVLKAVVKVAVDSVER